MESKYYDKIIGVTPTDLYELAKAPGRRKNMLKFLIELPIIGTFIYNMEVSKNRIIDAFVNNYYYKGHMVSEKRSRLTIRQHILVMAVENICLQVSKLLHQYQMWYLQLKDQQQTLSDSVERASVY